jgi:hypothetical protein
MIPPNLLSQRRGGRGAVPSQSFGLLLMYLLAFSAPLRFAVVGDAEAQEPTAHGQAWEVHLDTGRVTVGDTVGVRFRLRLDERDLLFDTLPRPVDSVLDGVRIVSIEKLHRLPNRDFVGRATLAFYRTGPQPLPVFALPFMRAVKGITNGTIRSDTVSVDVVPTLAAGNPTLRDIRELEPSSLPRILIGAGITAVVALLFLLVWRRRARRVMVVAPVEVEPVIVASPPDPHQVAVARLGEIEREAWVMRGDVARHYELVADVLRDYLEAAEGVPARERTTSEVLWSMPPRLVEGPLRRRYAAVFDEADLVKFARQRPPATAAAGFLDDARGLLARWHAAHRMPEETDAVR